MCHAVSCDATVSMVRMLATDVVHPDVLFHALDLDESGFVSVEEVLILGGACDADWAGWTPQQCAKAAGTAELDTMRHGEFCRFVSAVQPWYVEASRLRNLIDSGLKARAAVSPYDYDTIVSAFEAIDTDGSGYIDIDELMHFSAAVNAGWNLSACQKLLGVIDVDGDARISLEEFEAFVGEVGLHGCYEQVVAFILAGESRRATRLSAMDEAPPVGLPVAPVDATSRPPSGSVATPMPADGPARAVHSPTWADDVKMALTEALKKAIIAQTDDPLRLIADELMRQRTAGRLGKVSALDDVAHGKYGRLVHASDSQLATLMKSISSVGEMAAREHYGNFGIEDSDDLAGVVVAVDRLGRMPAGFARCEPNAHCEQAPGKAGAEGDAGRPFGLVSRP